MITSALQRDYYSVNAHFHVFNKSSMRSTIVVGFIFTPGYICFVNDIPDCFVLSSASDKVNNTALWDKYRDVWMAAATKSPVIFHCRTAGRACKLFRMTILLCFYGISEKFQVDNNNNILYLYSALPITMNTQILK